MNLQLIGEEIFIGNFNESGSRVDIMAKNKERKFDEGKVKEMIVSRGYPLGVYEKELSFVGYVI